MLPGREDPWHLGSLPTREYPRITVRDARFAVIVLTAMNLLNYFDRYVPSAAKELFKGELGLTDAETSWPLTAFVVVYMLTSPVFAALADRVKRTTIIAIGVALWSLATSGAALATGFLTLLLARAAVGVGEAAYATLAPPLIGDLYPPERRNRILTWFYVAIPVGAALGFSVGGALAARFGWRVAFLLCGAPGLLVAALALKIRDPGGGERESGPTVSYPRALRALAKNPHYLYAVLGYTAVTFAAGGMADWLPTYLHRRYGMELARAGSTVGMVTVLGGLGGTLVGGMLADRLVGKTKNPYLALSGWSMIAATLLAAGALLTPSATLCVAGVGLAQFFLWFYSGPINTEIVNSTEPALRARAFSLSILAIHLFGDAISPPIIGAVSDATGSLSLAVLIVPLAMAAGAAVWCVGWRRA